MLSSLNILDSNINTLAHTPALGCCVLTDNDSYVYEINDGKIYKREIHLLKKYDSVSIVNSR